MRAIHFFWIWFTVACICAYVRFFFAGEQLAEMEGGSNE